MILITKKKLNEIIQEAMSKTINEWTKNINEQVSQSVIQRDEWKRHASRVEQHGVQIERFLASFEVIANKILDKK